MEPDGGTPSGLLATDDDTTSTATLVVAVDPGSHGERTCIYCMRTFVDVGTRNRHIKKGRCPIMKQNESIKHVITDLRNKDSETYEVTKMHVINTLLSRIEALEKQLEVSTREHKERIEKLEKCLQSKSPQPPPSSRTINNTINNGTINHNHITINNYGNEDVTHITHDDKIQWASDPSKGVIAYVEKKHFDPNKPANHNVKMISVKREELAVHMDGKWIRHPAKPFMGKVLEHALDYLSGAIDWETISPEAEKYFADVSEDLMCRAGKQSVSELICLVSNHRDASAPPGKIE